MNQIKIRVYTTYDTQFSTWNVMTLENQCLFFGSIFQMENWLDEHADQYQEVKIIAGTIIPAINY